MKVLLVTMYFPPAGGGGVQRPLKIATHRAMKSLRRMLGTGDER